MSLATLGSKGLGSNREGNRRVPLSRSPQYSMAGSTSTFWERRDRSSRSNSALNLTLICCMICPSKNNEKATSRSSALKSCIQMQEQARLNCSSRAEASMRAQAKALTDGEGDAAGAGVDSGAATAAEAEGATIRIGAAVPLTIWLHDLTEGPLQTGALAST